MFDSVQNNTWLFFPFITVWISVLYEPSFQTLIKCFAFNLTHKRISRLLHMFFKELCMFAYCLVINVHLLFAVRSRVSFVRLSRPANFVNNFFYFFQNIFSNVFRRYFERRKRDLNPRAAINDLLPFQGSPFGQLGYFSKHYMVFTLLH